jgi:hypothetical protein
MSRPQNAKAVQRALRERKAIRRVWLELIHRRPFERVTAKDIAPHLRFKLADCTICWHMRAIRTEAIVANLSTVDAA